MATNYDDISDDYLKVNNPIKKYCEAFTFTRVLGNIKAKSALDLACGDGYYTRLIKQQGAAQTVGVDISEKMLARAKQAEIDVPLGIEYRTGDVSKLGQIGQFDLVTAIYLFPYATTKFALAGMLKTIYENLIAGGRLVAITLDPNLSEDDLSVFQQYGVNFVAEASLKDGTTLTVTIVNPDRSSVRLQTTFWDKATHENAIRQIGFAEIRWRPIQVSQEGLKEYGATYWQAFSAKPYAIILECYK